MPTALGGRSGAVYGEISPKTRLARSSLYKTTASGASGPQVRTSAGSAFFFLFFFHLLNCLVSVFFVFFFFIP